MTEKIGTPIIPRNKKDPTQSSRQVSKFFQDIESRYLAIKRALRVVIDEAFTGTESTTNERREWFLCLNEDSPSSIFRVNAGAFVYDMTGAQLATLLERVQSIVDEYLLEGGKDNHWSLNYITDEFERGTQLAFTNFSVQSENYATRTTLAQLLSSPAYQNQIAAAYISAYSEWTGISDKARADLAGVISQSIGRGVSPRETARIISRRLDVSMAQAKTIAQTEQVGALREAQWLETDWAERRLGLNTALLHISALKATTRREHARFHARIRTTDEVREWYTVNGNRFNCYCTQIPVILDENGELVNKGMIERLIAERKDWFKEFANAA